MFYSTSVRRNEDAMKYLSWLQKALFQPFSKREGQELTAPSYKLPNPCLPSHLNKLPPHHLF